MARLNPMIRIKRYLRRLFAIVFYAGLFAVSVCAAFALRFEFAIPAAQMPLLWQGVAISVLLKVFVVCLAGFHRGGWRHAGIPDVVRLLLANVAGSAAFTLGSAFLIGRAFPRSVYCIDFLISFVATAGARLAIRMYFEATRDRAQPARRKHILIYGAGAAATILVREIRSNPSLDYHVLGFLDDDPQKYRMNILGVTVLGPGRSAPLIVDRFRRKRVKVDEIVIAMPSASGVAMNEALANCRAANVPCKTIPGLGGLLNGEVLTNQIRSLRVEDLLGRKPVHLDESQIRTSIQGRSVMVTGGGGSIGSELCRQIASFEPAQLVVFERAESDLFRIDMELRHKFPELAVIPQIGDIREYGRVEQVICRYAVESIFHAAAYKHVPMMESHLFEAVKNNILGTWNLVRAAERHGVAQFLMISSDKAVNPTNIMGLTKRVAEVIMSSRPVPGEGSRTKFVAVRFGNVLGSNGSVVPLFSAQIEAGGPVTVTHPEVRRYFMTVQEAVQLVLQASTMSKGSEIFVLDMGEPVRISDLARNMIRLSGHEPGVDIEIRYVGLRPGEKLYEELLLKGEDILPTYHPKIRIYRGASRDGADIEQWLSDLEQFVNAESESGVLRHLGGLVPEYRTAGKGPHSEVPHRTQAAVAS